MAVMLILSLYTARIVFNTLGIEDYGTYNIVGSIIVLFSFLNNGLSNATKRYITAEIATGTNESCRKIFNTAVIAHILIALLIFIVAETLGLWVVNTVLSIPRDRMFAANIVYQLSVLSALLGIMQSPFSSAILAYERMNIYAYFSIVDVICKLLLIWLIQKIDGDKLIIYAILIFVIGLINVIIYRAYCYHQFVMCQWQLVKDKLLLKKMFTYTSWSLFGQASVVASNQGVSLLINLFFGVTVNAAMGISNSITKIVNDFVVNFQYAFNPQITKHYVAGETEELKKLVWNSSRYSSFLVLLFMMPVCFEARDFLHLWLGDFPKYSVEFCILTIISIYFEAITAPLWMVLCSDSDIKTYQLTVSSIFMLNVVFSFILLSIGLPPFIVIAVRVIVDIILILTRLFFVERKVDGFSKYSWLKAVLGNSILVIILPFILTYIVQQINIEILFLRLVIVSGSSFLATAISIFILGMSFNERKFVYSKFGEYVSKCIA